jgi:hypothetical protein
VHLGSAFLKSWEWPLDDDLNRVVIAGPFDFSLSATPFLFPGRLMRLRRRGKRPAKCSVCPSLGFLCAEFSVLVGHPSARRMLRVKSINRWIKYKPAGCCIYCGSAGDPTLHIEHIIPKGLGGKLELPQASCEACASNTSAVEGHVISKLYGDTRALLGLRRGKGKWPDKFAVLVKPAKRKSSVLKLSAEKGAGFEPRLVSADQIPGSIILLNFDKVAGMLRGDMATTEDFKSDSMSIASASQNMLERLRCLGGEVFLGGGLSSEEFGLFLAKIAHAYATARLGIGSFIPFLTSAIRRERPMYLARYVGRAGSVPIEPTDSLHVLQEGLCDLPNGRRLVLVRVRLFANQPIFPAYDIVVGEATRATPLF